MRRVLTLVAVAFIAASSAMATATNAHADSCPAGNPIDYKDTAKTDQHILSGIVGKLTSYEPDVARPGGLVPVIPSAAPVGPPPEAPRRWAVDVKGALLPVTFANLENDELVRATTFTGSVLLPVSFTADVDAATDADIVDTLAMIVDHVVVRAAKIETCAPPTTPVTTPAAPTTTIPTTPATTTAPKPIPPARFAPGQPAIIGTPRVGERVSALVGTWTPRPIGYGYQWYANGVAIAGATGSTIVLTAAQYHRSITVRITGSRTGYVTTAATSRATALVALGVIQTHPIGISGVPKVGVRLTAVTARWSPVPRLTYTWYANGRPIAGAHASAYVVPRTLAGTHISVRVTGVSTGYTTVTRTSSSTAAVRR